MSRSVQIQRESFSVTSSDTSGGLNLQVTASGETGNIDIEATVDNVGALPGPGAQIIPSTVRVRPESLSRIRDMFNSATRQISNRLNVPTNKLRILANQAVPTSQAFVFSRSLNPGQILPTTFTFNSTFEPIAVPMPDNVDLNDLNLNITSSLRVSIIPNSFFKSISSQLPEVTIELPPEAFIAKVPFNAFSCDELNPILSRIESRVDVVKQRIVSNTPAGAATSFNEVENLVDDLEQEILSFTDSNNIENVTREDIQAKIREFRTEVSDDTDSPRRFAGGLIPSEALGQERVQELTELSDIINQVENLPRVRDVPDTIEDTILDAGRCMSNVNNINNEITRLQNLRSQINELKRTALGISIKDIEPPEPEEPEKPELPERPELPECVEEVPNSLDNAINNYRSDVRQANQPLLPNQREELVNRGDDLLTRIENEVPGRCVNQIKQRVRPLRNRAIDLRTRLSSCGNKHPRMEERVSQYEDDIIALNPPLSPNQVQSFVRRGNNLRQRINREIDDPRCQRGFSERVKNVTNRLQSLTTQLRIRKLEGIPQQEDISRLVQLLEQQIQEAERARLRIRSGVIDEVE